VRVFSADCRSFITPVNYQRTAPNVISGFLRPIQNVVFSLVYPFFGVNARAYFLMHVVLHAANASLFFLFCRLFVPISLAFLAGVMFAFYPNVSWLPWIGTVQNSLATLFLLLAGFAFWKSAHNIHNHVFLSSRASYYGVAWLSLSGFLFLISLLSREIGIFLPFWIFLGAYAYAPHKKSKQPVVTPGPFFLATIIYTLMRLWAFGIRTIPRTIYNLTLRYPVLAKYFGNKATVITIVPPAQIPHATITAPAQKTAPACDYIVQKIQLWAQKLSVWTESLFNLHTNTCFLKVFSICFLLCLCVALVLAYRNNKKLFCWLLFGTACTMWPGVLTYPCPRYLNVTYPFIIFILIYGMFLLWRDKKPWPMAFGALLIVCSLLLTDYGLFENRHQLKASAQSTWGTKERFDAFFAAHTFEPDANFVLLSSPLSQIYRAFFRPILGT